MLRLRLLLCLCFAVPAFSQSAPSLGQAAVSAVLAHYTVNTFVLLPDTHKPLPDSWQWSIKTARPETCPHDDTPCARVIYTVPEAHVACERTIVPPKGAAPADFLD